MSEGFAGVREGVKAAEARRVEYPKEPRFVLREAGDWAIVRFMNQGDEFQWTYCHSLPREGSQWGDVTPCVHGKEHSPVKGCPMCDRGIKRSLRGFMPLIWRGAPVFKRENNKMVKGANGQYIQTGNADMVCVWTNINLDVCNVISEKDVAMKGLRSRDMKVTRFGDRPRVSYNIDPADIDSGPQMLSEADQKLWKEANVDLSVYLKPLPQEVLFTRLGMAGAVVAGQDVEQKAADVESDFNAFMQ